MTRLWQAYHKDITRIWQGYDKDMTRIWGFHSFTWFYLRVSQGPGAWSSAILRRHDEDALPTALCSDRFFQGLGQIFCRFPYPVVEWRGTCLNMFEYRDISFSVKDQSKINWSYFYGMMIQNLLDVDLDDLAAIPVYLGITGSTWNTWKHCGIVCWSPPLGNLRTICRLKQNEIRGVWSWEILSTTDVPRSAVEVTRKLHNFWPAIYEHMSIWVNPASEC